MKWHILFSAIIPAAMLLLVSNSVQIATADLCKCSNLTCTQMLSQTPNSGCCLWDFPPNSDASSLHGFEKQGYALGMTTIAEPHLCITYPIANELVERKNYFLVLVDLQQGADVCISEPGKTKNRSCSTLLPALPVAKADYCPGEAVGGVQSIEFSLDCIGCDDTNAVFHFRIYSESFNTSQDHWCDTVNKTVPSELVAAQTITLFPPPPTDGGVNEGDNEGDKTPNVDGDPDELIIIKDNHSGVCATLPATLLSLLVTVLFAVMVVH